MISSLVECPPWLFAEGQRLLARAAAQRLPHALLLTGMVGIGKRAFADWLVQSLLCRERTEQGACGQCDDCRQHLSGAHSDFMKLEPEGANTIIKVDRVRELVTWLQLTARDGGYRIALLQCADTMNRNAANSLLKTLEEPGEQAVLILVADRVGELPATVRSRCQKITLRLENTASATDWLAGHIEGDAAMALSRTAGGPFSAVEAAQESYQSDENKLLKAWLDLFLHRASVGRIVDSLSDFSTARCLKAFDHWAALALRHQMGVGMETSGVDPALQEAISQIGSRLTNEQWFTIHDRILLLYRSDSASFRTSTVLEGLFADIRLMIPGSR
ncbi:MAG: DNA polymerase III subunit delta' [Granulosicoccus sp.]